MRFHRGAGAVVLLGFVPLTTLAAAVVNTADLARCAAIAGADQRLACYDSLARHTLPPPPPPPAPAAAAAKPSGVSPSAPVAAPVGTPVAAASAAANPPPPNFGLSKHEQTAPDQVEAMKAVVTQVTTDRQNNVHVTLDNGQVWAFNESDAPVRPGDTVTLKRSALGSYLLITASHKSWHAQRLQ